MSMWENIEALEELLPFSARRTNSTALTISDAARSGDRVRSPKMLHGLHEKLQHQNIWGALHFACCACFYWRHRRVLRGQL